MKRIVVGAGIAAAGWATYAAIQRWRATWGVDLDERWRALPGDDLIETPLASDTRGITIEAPPELVWPWLVQMGYGRGGWYSIDRLDMRGCSADRIVDEWQTLAVGDVLPTHPGGGFAVKVLEPGRALVLHADPASMQTPDDREPPDVPAGLAASGAFLSTTPSEFEATWAFVVEPIGPGRTRLIERVRYWGAAGSPGAKVVMPIFGFGVFVMMQRQMVGIQRRAERLASEPRPATPVAPDNGHAPALAEAVIATT
jgi:hypothetical protein